MQSIQDVIFFGANFSIGDRSYINRGCTFDCEHGNVNIGSDVGIAFNVSVYITQHDYSDPDKRLGMVRGESVFIDDGVWVGANTTICPGVNIGKGCVICW